jgi:hypothetical protein
VTRYEGMSKETVKSMREAFENGTCKEILEDPWFGFGLDFCDWSCLDVKKKFKKKKKRKVKRLGNSEVGGYVYLKKSNSWIPMEWLGL